MTIRYVYDPALRGVRKRLRIFLIFQGGEEKKTYRFLKQYGEGFGVSRTEPGSVALLPNDIENIATVSRALDYFVFKSEQFIVPRSLRTEQQDGDPTKLDFLLDGLDERVIIDVRVRPVDISPTVSALRAISARLETLQTEHYAEQLSESRDELGHLVEEFKGRRGAEFEINAVSSDADVARRAITGFAFNTIGAAGLRVSSMDSSDPHYKDEVEAFVQVRASPSLTSRWSDKELEAVVLAHPTPQPEHRLVNLAALSRARHLLGSREAQRIVQLPVPMSGALRTFPLETEVQQSLPIVHERRCEDMIFLGENAQLRSPIWIKTQNLNKHVFVAGVTGSGKTVTMGNLLSQLSDQGVPFLVLEPAKKEYRSLLGFSNLRQNMRVYTPGRDDLSPLRLNPFAVPVGTPIAKHIAGLSAAFNAALDLGHVASALVEEALWFSYANHHWLEDDDGGVCKTVPSLTEFYANLRSAVDNTGYDAEILARLKGQLQNRFLRLRRGSIGRIFSGQLAIPSISELFKASAVIELGHLQPAEANLVSLLLLSSMRSHLEASSESRSQLRQVIVIEEAHNLVPDTNGVPAGGEDSAGADIETSRYVSNMLAELRALGLGIVIVDQTPSAVSEQVMRNTNLKIVHRTVAKKDRDALSEATMMSQSQGELLGKLRPGQAFIYSDQMFRPELSQIPFKEETSKLAKREISSNEMLSDANLVSELAVKPWFKHILKQRLKDVVDRQESLKPLMKKFADDYIDVNSFIQSPAQDGGVKNQLEGVLDDLHVFAASLLSSVNEILVEYRALEVHGILGKRAREGISYAENWREHLVIAQESLKRPDPSH